MSTPKPERTGLMNQVDRVDDDTSHDDTSTATETALGSTAIQPPFWLRKSALLMFFLVFAICAAALIALDRLIANRNGLPLLTSSEYSWMYGPTGLLVIILSFWRQIDYYYKYSQPWKELSKGSAPAEKSLLLDYISASQPTSIVQALKMRHYEVVGTTLSFLLLKLVILASTTLFVVRPSLHHEPFLIEYQNAFNGAAAWVSGGYQPLFEAPENAILLGGSDKPVWAYLATINNATALNMTWYPQDGLVTQSFRVPNSTLNITTLRANVDVFVPQIACDSAELSVTTNERRSGLLYKLGTPTCSVAKLDVDLLCPDAVEDRLRKPLCESEPQIFMLHRVNCSLGFDGNDTSHRNWPGDFEGYDIRYAITATQPRLQVNRSNEYSPAIKSVEMLRYSSVICKIGYEITSANATHDLSTGRVTFTGRNMDEKPRQLRGLENYEMAEMLLAALYNATDVLITHENIPTTKSTGRLTSRADETLFQLMVAKLGLPDDLGVLYEPHVLKEASTSVLEGVAKEFARQSLLVANTSSGFADGVASGRSRLYVRIVTLRVMVAAFVALAAICLLIMTMASSSPWIPAMSGSIAGQASILVNSPSLQLVLKDTGHFRGSQLKESLKGMLFTAALDNRAIQVQEDASGPTQQPSEGKKEKKKRLWMPSPARRPFVGALVVLPILVIGCLECLYRLSEKWHGLVHLNKTGSDVFSYIVRLGSTSIVFGINTMFNNLDSTIVIFAHFSSLRLGSVDADKSILFYLLGVSPFKVLFKSFRRRQFGAAASNLSSIIGGLLTIAVSGLWIPTGPFTVEGSSTASINNWNGSWLNNSLHDGGAAIMLNLIHRQGAKTAAGIWKDVVMPRIELPSASNPNAGNHEANYTYSVEVIRPTFNCTVVAQENIRSARPRKPDDGRVSITQWSLSNITVDAAVPPEWWYFDLDSVAGQVGTECPSVGILFGDVEYDEDDDVGKLSTKTWNLRALVCSQGIEQVPANVTFSGDPSRREVNAQKPPVLSPTEARSWRNGTAEARTLGYKLQGFLELYLAPFSLTEHDSFFDHLLFGPEGYRRDGLVGPDNINKLIEAVTRDYKEYMRHVIDINFRAKSNSTLSSLVSASGGTSSTPSGADTEIVGRVSQAVTRLAIHFVSKLTLQVLLGSMMVLSLLGYCLVKLRGTLPRNPTSIGGTMSLLTGSQLCDKEASIIPEAAELMSDSQLKQAFDGWVFSLGWWSSSTEELVTGVEESEATTERDPSLGEDLDEEIPGDAASPVEKRIDRFGVDVGKASISGH